MDIKVVKMVKPSYASFSSLMFDKFRALQITKYKRFMYLDSDIIPLVNLDYYFHLSDPDEKSVPTILQPNFNSATKKAPCNGGMFMMHPASGAWEQLAHIVHRQREEGRKLPYPHFDFQRGWGHDFEKAGDYWEGTKRAGAGWHFYGSHTDQGLWYYFSKYVRQDVSILVGTKLQTWSYNGDAPVKVKEAQGELEKYSPKPLVYQFNCDDPTFQYRCYPPHTDIAHFMGKEKPWIMGKNLKWFKKNDTNNMNEAIRLWFKELDEVNRKLHLGLDVHNWNDNHKDLKVEPPLGYTPNYADNAKEIIENKSLLPDSMNTDTKNDVKVKKEGVKMIENGASDNEITNRNIPSGKEGRSYFLKGNHPTTTTKVVRYAYNFVLGGIHESQLAYKGFLYNILISVNLLKKLGSEADFWVWAQLSPNSTLDTIPEEDMSYLEAMNIKVVEMEKASHASFSSLMFDKFRALQITKYKRFIYLDSDVIPLVNLDYYFHLSDPDEKSLPTILQPNLNWASKRAPCNGGMFMMHPASGAWEQLAAIIDRQHKEGRELPYPHFDKRTRGWGHSFKESRDFWESEQKRGANWAFHGGHTDQGLWYYYSKYVRQEVSIVIGDRIQTWNHSNDENAELPVKIKEVKGELAKYSPKPIVYQYHCDYPDHECFPPSTDIAHFMNRGKPWLIGLKTIWINRKNDTEGLNEPHRLWFKELNELNEKLHMGLDVYNWDVAHKNLKETPLYGYQPKFSENAKFIFEGGKLLQDTNSIQTDN